MAALWSADPSYDVVIWRSAGILAASILGVGSVLRSFREMSSGRCRILLVPARWRRPQSLPCLAGNVGVVEL